MNQTRLLCETEYPALGAERDENHGHGGPGAGAVVLEVHHVPIENVMLEEQVAGLERGWFSMHYFDIPMLQKYFAQRWAGEDAGLTEEQGGELAGELNGCIKLAHDDGKMLVLNAFRSNGTPLAGQPQTVSFNMVPVMMQLAATANRVPLKSEVPVRMVSPPVGA